MNVYPADAFVLLHARGVDVTSCLRSADFDEVGWYQVAVGEVLRSWPPTGHEGAQAAGDVPDVDGHGSGE